MQKEARPGKGRGDRSFGFAPGPGEEKKGEADRRKKGRKPGRRAVVNRAGMRTGAGTAGNLAGGGHTAERQQDRSKHRG